MIRPWSLIVLGCGTVGFWVVRCLLELPLLERRLERIVLCDKGYIGDRNAITCPLYSGHSGRLKCERLAELLPSSVDSERLVTLPGRVEQVDWTTHFPSGGRVIVLMGLDDWQSRLTVTQDLRLTAARKSATDAVLIQAALQKDEAQVAVFGAGFDDPCPACGIRVLPQAQPCTAEDDTGLLHGNLHREAEAAANFVRGIIVDILSNQADRSWVNTKTNIYLPGPRTMTRTCSKREGCLGSHHAVAPLRWDKLLPPLSLSEGGRYAG